MSSELTHSRPTHRGLEGVIRAFKKADKEMSELPTPLKFVSALSAGAILAGCAYGVSVQPTLSAEPGSTNPNQTSPENATDITTGELAVVTDSEIKSKVIASLPKDRPEAEGGDEKIDVSVITFGDQSLYLAAYPLSEKAKAEKMGEINQSTNFEPQVAMYTEYINYDGSKTMVRLAGEDLVVLDQNGKQTGEIKHLWYFQESGYQTQNGLPTDRTRPVFGYSYPGEDVVVYQPLISPGFTVPGYDPEDGLFINFKSGIPEAMKVSASITEVESEASIDLSPSYTQEIDVEYMGVQIKGQVITDQTSAFDQVTLKDDKFAEYFAKSYFKVLQRKRYQEWGKKTFEQFMDTWSRAQNGDPTVDPSLFDITIWANDIKTEGYKQNLVTVRFMIPGETPEGVISINKFAVALVEDVPNITNFEGSQIHSGLATNIDGETLLYYANSWISSSKGDYENKKTVLSKIMSDFAWWLYTNQGGRMSMNSGLPDLDLAALIRPGLTIK